MKESADPSDLLCFKRPKMTLQQFKTQMILSRGARYDLILSNSNIVSCTTVSGARKHTLLR